jgi:two-component system nitrate/nitrite response regulator NarL
MYELCVVIYHPSRLFSEGIKKILESGMFKVHYAGPDYNGSIADVLGDGARPVFIVGGHNGISSVEKLRNDYCDALIIFTVLDRNEKEAAKALASGANCYLRETIDSDLLFRTLNLLAHDELVLCSAATNGTQIDNKHAARPTDGFDSDTPKYNGVCDEDRFDGLLSKGTYGVSGNLPLSERELVILRALVKGSANKVIANELDITEATVKVHVKAILRKLSAKNRTQAAIWAVRHMPAQFSNQATHRPPVNVVSLR